MPRFWEEGFSAPTNPTWKDMPVKKQAKMHKVMREFKIGKLHSGSKKGPKVKSRKQAVAIGLSSIKKAMGSKRGY